MKTPVKIALGCLGVAGLLFVLLLAAFFHVAKGFDASKEDPRKLYARFIQEEIPSTVKVHRAVGGGSPIGGTGVTFYFEIGQKDLDALISSKDLQRTEDRLFTNDEYVGGMRSPEFYLNSITNLFRIQMAVDRETGKVLYFTYSL